MEIGFLLLPIMYVLTLLTLIMCLGGLLSRFFGIIGYGIAIIIVIGMYVIAKIMEYIQDKNDNSIFSAVVKQIEETKKAEIKRLNAWNKKLNDLEDSNCKRREYIKAVDEFNKKQEELRKKRIKVVLGQL